MRLIIERRLQAGLQIDQIVQQQLERLLQVEPLIVQAQPPLQDKLRQLEVQLLHQAEALKRLQQDKVVQPLRVLQQQHQQGVQILNLHQAELVALEDK